ncbi:MAG: S-adenosyl-L-methionine-dependent methyltransferase [Monoraphidium minutum]|nr:MAG: S-adenosyl-L-methionine-dependent methyltransferase [Monoraphidium minutum]
MISRGLSALPVRCLRRPAAGAAAVARPGGARRRVHARPIAAAEVQTTVSVEDATSTEEPYELGDVRVASPEAAQPPSYAELRRRPVNFAPETRFTVDCVADVDAECFQQHPSVLFWRTWGTQLDTRSLGNNIDGSRASASSMAETALGLLTSSAASDAEAAAYWAYHLGRTSFFLATSAAGAIAHHLSEQLAGGSRRTPLENLSANAQAEISNRLYEAVAVYQQDLAAIKAGSYKLPWDMTTPTHRQFSPFYMARKASLFINEAVGTLNRRLSEADASNWFSSDMYPKYYMDNTFHYQTDGWLSPRSATVYEFSTESLFFGRQDAMQRSALLGISEWLQETGRDPSSLKLLEVACGTGRFHTFIKDNYPAMQTICSDLSPFYLDAARNNVAYWKRARQAATQLGGGPGGAGTTFLQCPAEAVPAADGSLDVVVCVYLFHELPEEARIACAREWARVLKPGGLVVLADSAQLGDRPAWDATLGAFGSFNEPHYRNYIACDMGGLFESAGFTPRTKYLSSATKTLTFTKRGAAPAAAASDGAPAASAAAASEGAEEMADPSLN